MSSRPLSPSLSTHGTSPRPRSPLATEQRVSCVHPTDLTPVEAADLKDHEAERLLAQGDLDGALHALQKAIYLRPDYAPLHAKLARVYWELCDLKSAMACYRKLFAIDPNPPQRVKDQFASLLDLHGYSLLRLGESPAVAIAYLSEAIQLNSLEETYWLHRALAHIQCNCFDKALKDVDHCVNLNGRDVEYFVLRAKLHWKLHMHEKATQDIHKAARLMPEHPEVVEHERRLRDESQTIYAQACRHLLVRNFAEAIKCLAHAAEISPDETKIYLLRASAHRELGDLQSAMSDIDKALSCHCHRLEMEHQKKASLRGRDETLAATATEDCTKEYRDIATQRNLILNDLALRCLRDKSYQVALNAMNQVVQGEMEIATRFHETLVNAQYYVNRGDAYRGLGNLQAALADYHHALEVGSERDDHEVRARVALIHYQFGIDFFNAVQFSKAELEFAKAIAQDKTVATYHVRKGDAARFQEKHHVACEDYMNAMRLNPNDTDTQNKLLQYAIDPKRKAVSGDGTSPHRRPPRSLRNDLVERTDASPNQQQQQHEPSPGGPRKSAVAAALESYKQKNRLVQDLFVNRPAMNASKGTAKKPPE